MTAYDNYALSGNIESQNGFSVTLSAPTDTFEFFFEGIGQIQLYLHNISGGDADLRLYFDSNKNGILDIGIDERVARSENSGTENDLINLSSG